MRLQAHLQVCFVSWVQKVLMGQNGLAEGEMDKSGWRSQIREGGLGAVEDE